MMPIVHVVARNCVKHASLIRMCRCAIIAASFFAQAATAQVYKCEDAAGKTTYSDAPCAKASTALKLPSDSGGGLTQGSVCAQLLDERRRLAAEAEREKARGHVESASNIKRRESLRQQYEKRCIGIRRSEP